MTSYPSVKDTTSTFLVINGITPIDSALFLRYSSAILAIESELGVNPSGVYSDVRQRLDSIDGYTSKGGFLPTGTIYQHLEYSGTSWDAVDNITLPENSGDERIITLATPTIGSTNLGIYTPISSGTMNSGDITIYTGTAGREGGYAGNLFIGCLSSFSDSAYYNSRNGVKYNGAIEIIAGGQSASNSIAGSIYMESGSGYGLNSKGGNFYLKPGSANTQNDLGKLLICAADLYGQPAFTNKYYPIYVRTDNVDGYYPGIRYNNLSDVWEFKNDGYTENQWIPIGTGTGSSTSSSNSIIDITWQGSVSDGYLVYADKYSSNPYLKIANLAKANNYLYSNVIGAAYSETDKVIINGVHSVYCETSTVPGNILYLSPNNSGMTTTTVPTLSTNCITIIGKCFSEKSSGIGLCDVLLDIKEPILLE